MILFANLERAKGIEPSYAAWEAAVLPLNYARKPLNLFSILNQLSRFPRQIPVNSRAYRVLCTAQARGSSYTNSKRRVQTPSSNGHRCICAGDGHSLADKVYR